jgi:hypothetical protein
MKRKWLFLPDILLLLLVCLTCERRELSHKPFNSDQPIILAKANNNKINNRIRGKGGGEEETKRVNFAPPFFNLKARILKK